MIGSNSFAILVDHVCSAWPEHRRFLDRSWAKSSFHDTANLLAASVLQLANGQLGRFIEGYRWMCGMMQEEDLYFQRHGVYRMSSFAEVQVLVYQSPDLMQRYMDGLLLSQVLWTNHVRVFEFYLNQFLAKIRPKGRHLEIGPGHGLLLHYAMQVLTTSPTAWDISSVSLESTRACLAALADTDCAALECRDIMSIDADACTHYDSIVISEVLEHSEEPERMLRNVVALLAPGGRIYINVPVNSPSIDHISLFGAPEEVVALVERVGLEIEEVLFAPAAGYDEATARRYKTTISCAIIARSVELPLLNRTPCGC